MRRIDNRLAQDLKMSLVDFEVAHGDTVLVEIKDDDEMAEEAE